MEFITFGFGLDEFLYFYFLRDGSTRDNTGEFVFLINEESIMIESFKFEGLNSRKYVFESNNTSYLRVIQPGIHSDEFSFRFSAENFHGKCFNFGVVDPSHPKHPERKKNIGGPNKGWGFWMGSGVSSSPCEENPPNGICHDLEVGRGMKECESVGFRVSKSEKKIWLLINDNEESLIHESCDFPDILHIAASCVPYTPKGSYIELIEITGVDYPYVFPINELLKEGNERLEFIHQKFSNFTIPLSNKSLDIPKPLLYQSNIENLSEIEEYDRLAELSFQIDEFILIQILSGIPNFEIPTIELFDYYRFFKFLGLQREMYIIITLLSSSSKLLNFKQTFELFHQVVVDYETDIIQSWFTSSPEYIKTPIILTTFRNSFSYILFMSLKSKCDVGSIDESSTSLPINTIINHLKLLTSSEEIIDHPDFSEFQLKDIKNPFSQLFSDKKQELCNLTLITASDNDYEVKVHREVLILKSNFFFRMFHFGGVEMEEMEKTSRVRLHDISFQDLEFLIRFYYTDDLLINKTVDLNILLRCMIHCDKFFEREVVGNLFVLFCQLIEEQENNEKIKKWIEEIGHLIKSEEIKKILINSLRGRIDEENIEKMLKISKEMEKKGFVEEILRENEMLKYRVGVMEREIEMMKKKFMVEMEKVNERLKKLEK